VSLNIGEETKCSLCTSTATTWGIIIEIEEDKTNLCVPCLKEVFDWLISLYKERDYIVKVSSDTEEIHVIPYGGIGGKIYEHKYNIKDLKETP